MTAEELHTIAGWAIRHKRKGLGLTLKTVAGKAGISIGQLSAIERSASCRLSTYLAICTALDVAISYLFSGQTAALYEAAHAVQTQIFSANGDEATLRIGAPPPA